MQPGLIILIIHVYIYERFQRRLDMYSSSSCLSLVQRYSLLTAIDASYRKIKDNNMTNSFRQV